MISFIPSRGSGCGATHIPRILLQTPSQETPELWASLFFLQHRRLSFRNQEQHAHGVILRQRWLSFRHLDGGDTQRPDISLRVVSRLADHFGGHPEWGADKGVPLRGVGRELGGDTKVRCQVSETLGTGD